MSGVTQAVFQNQRSFVIVTGQQTYTGAGSYSWTAPTGVTSVSVVAVGGTLYNGGGAESGAGLGYKNNIAVVPGSSYTVVVGTGDSYFISTSTVKGGGNASTTGGTFFGDGGGTGGNTFSSAQGGGAGGYAGEGGSASGAGAGGGGGGGGTLSSGVQGSVGGGVGLLGQGANGAGGANGVYQYPVRTTTYGGGGGSGGTSGGTTTAVVNANGSFGTFTRGQPGNYGGGTATPNTNPGAGAVRIIWPGDTRAFPSTNTTDL
jgi:hypothetical protein